MTTLQRVLMLGLDIHQGPCVYHEYPPSEDAFPIDRFKSIFIPKSELTGRTSWLYEASSREVLLYFPEELQGSSYERNVLRYTLCLVFDVLHPEVTLCAEFVQKHIQPYEVALLNIMEELRTAEGKYGCLSSGVGSLVQQHSNLSPLNAMNAGTMTMTPTTAPAAAALKKTTGSPSDAGGLIPPSLRSSVSPLSGSLNPPPSQAAAAATTAVAVSAPMSSLNAFVSKGLDEIVWYPLSSVLEDVFFCMTAKARYVRLSTYHRFHLQIVGKREQVPTISPYHVPVPIADLHGVGEWPDIAVADMAHACDGRRTILEIADVLNLQSLSADSTEKHTAISFETECRNSSFVSRVFSPAEDGTKRDLSSAIASSASMEPSPVVTVHTSAPPVFLDRIVVEGFQHLVANNYVRLLFRVEPACVYATTPQFSEALRCVSHPVRAALGEFMVDVTIACGKAAAAAALANMSFSDANNTTPNNEMDNVVNNNATTTSATNTTNTKTQSVMVLAAKLYRERSAQVKMTQQLQSPSEQQRHVNSALAEDDDDADRAASAAVCAVAKFLHATYVEVQAQMRRCRPWRGMFGAWSDDGMTALVEFCLLNEWLVQVHYPVF